MKRRALVSLAAVMALLFSTGRAVAQQELWARSRLGAESAGGLFIVPGVVTVGAIGPEFQLGLQFNNLIGIVLVPIYQFVVGKWSGSNQGIALVVDFTLNDTILVGVGPEVTSFSAGRTSGPLHEFVADGVLLGGKVQLAWSPDVLRVCRNGARKGVTFGVDLHLLGSGAGFLAGSANYPRRLVLSPVLTAAYQTAENMLRSLASLWRKKGVRDLSPCISKRDVSRSGG